MAVSNGFTINGELNQWEAPNGDYYVKGAYIDTVSNILEAEPGSPSIAENFDRFEIARVGMGTEPMLPGADGSSTVPAGTIEYYSLTSTNPSDPYVTTGRYYWLVNPEVDTAPLPTGETAFEFGKYATGMWDGTSVFSVMESLYASPPVTLHRKKFTTSYSAPDGYPIPWEYKAR